MATYHADWVENKSADWKIATLTGSEGTLKEVSINRTNKKGEVFPNFDAITPGADILGELWKSPAGKVYLFGPKEEKAYKTFAAKPTGIKAAQEFKGQMIEKAQGNKELGIKISSTIRMAVDIVMSIGTQMMTPTEIEQAIGRWRSWLWRCWEVDEKEMPPF